MTAKALTIRNAAEGWENCDTDLPDSLRLLREWYLVASPVDVRQALDAEYDRGRKELARQLKDDLGVDSGFGVDQNYLARLLDEA